MVDSNTWETLGDGSYDDSKDRVPSKVGDLQGLEGFEASKAQGVQGFEGRPFEGLRTRGAPKVDYLLGSKEGCGRVL